MGIPEGEERMKGRERLFKEKIYENFTREGIGYTRFKKLREYLTTSSKKTFPNTHYIKTQRLMIFLKASRENTVTYNNRLLYFSAETLHARK